MRSNGVVVLPPLLDHDLCLVQAVEDFSVEQLVAQLPVERFCKIARNFDPTFKVDLTWLF